MPVSEFLALYENPKTKANYLLAITTFLRFICDDETISAKNTKELNACAKAYLKSLKKERDIFYDLKLAANAYTKKYAPNTARLNLTIVIIWLEDNGNILSRRDRKRVFQSLPPPRPARKDPELTHELFAEIDTYLPLWAQVLLKLLAGTGMRIGEALALERRDLDETGLRTTAVIRAENAKTKTERMVVLTREAADALRKYMQTRTDKNQRIFPYSAGHAQYVLKKAKTAAAAGAPVVRMKKNIGLFHWHATRKWFLSQFKISASMAVGEMLAGHTGYLDGAYRRYSDDTITEEFIKAEPFIQIEEGVSGGVS